MRKSILNVRTAWQQPACPSTRIYAYLEYLIKLLCSAVRQGVWCQRNYSVEGVAGEKEMCAIPARMKRMVCEEYVDVFAPLKYP